jgi:hypothetical protein
MFNIIRIEQVRSVTKVYFDNAHGEINLLLSSDRHHDSLFCNRDLEERHLKEAKRREALIIDAGDLFDAMQGRYDPRRSYEDLRPEYKVEKYYDVVEEDAVSFYTPYKDNFLVFGRGGHEQSITRHANTDLNSRLVGDLRKLGSQCVSGGFGGWVVLFFGTNSGHRQSIKIKYNHGSGSEAPVTKGVIQTNRQAVYLPDADIVLNGHNHNEYVLSMKRERINSMGNLFFDLVHFVRTPGYKNDYNDGSEGFEVERMMNPKPQGAIWVNIIVSKGIKCLLTADVE